MSLLQNSNAISTGGAYNLESSLRFRGGQNLTRTITSASNRRTYTQSVWLKRGAIGTSPYIFNQYLDGNTNSLWYFNASSSEAFNVFNRIGGTNYQVQTSASFRDPSAWYHIVVATDTTQATASNRIKIWINGEQVTSFSATGYPPQNSDTAINSASTYYIGSGFAPSQYFDGYMTEYNFVDGQALTADDFGETDTTTGVWKPKEYTGTYGTNGFYLPMKETQQATGFNSVLYTGTGAAQTIDNVGFSPDLVWIKARDSAQNHYLADSVRGGNKYLYSNGTSAELTTANGITFESNGFQMKNTGNVTNGSGLDYVAWCWDAGSSTVSNTDGTITSSVRANPATGFSIVTGTTLASGTLSYGHGLGVSPAVVIYRSRTTSGQNWWVWHKDLPNASTGRALRLNTTDGEVNGAYFGTPAVSSTVATIAGGALNNDDFVSYCFSEVAGYSKFGSYTGNGSTSGPTITTGFRPALVMFKRTDSTGDWKVFDTKRSPDIYSGDNYANQISWNTSAAESSDSANIRFDDNGFQITANWADTNASGGTYIYMAFADTLDAQFNFDASGNKNNWTANNINSNASSETTYDIMNDVATLTDEDTSNYPVCNPLRGDDFNATYSNGNMTATLGGSSVTGMGTANWHIPTTGKWFWEVTIGNFSQWCALGIRKANATLSDWLGYTANDYSISQPGITKHNDTTYDASYTNTNIASGDVFGVAFDADNGTLKFYQNGADLGTAFTGLTDEYVPAFSGSSSVTQTLNFGQQPFKYTPPTGYKKLNTYNLPDSTIADGSEYFDTVTYTGDGLSTKTIDTYEFSPDLVWVKNRASAYNHGLFDSIRGADRLLKSNTTDAEGTATFNNQFLSNGFEFGSASVAWNQSGVGHVLWGWRGSDSSAVSNTDGTITSTVSANTTSGFSVVTYTGNSTAGSTVGHGLSSKPDVILLKSRSDADNWRGYHSALGATKDIILNSTSGAVTNSSRWNNTEPTSSVFTIGIDDGVNENGDNFVAYCFADVEGFSKFGSYTGLNNSDGPFVYLGFKPAFIMFKRTDSAQNWFIFDNTRSPYNTIDEELRPNTVDAEVTGQTNVDYLSNGFKIYSSGSAGINQAGNYIYMAFAENPFKQSLAR